MFAQLCGTWLWFSANCAADDLARQWGLTDGRYRLADQSGSRRVHRGHTMTIRASLVIPVYPLTEDLLTTKDPGTPPETVWSVLTKEYERVALHPDNPQYEAIEPARLRPDQVFEVAYKELISELRYNLRPKEDKPLPVFAFNYDWRQPLDWIEQQLAGFIEEVIERTNLLKHYFDAGFPNDPKVNLMGHSMGGMIIAGYLERRGRDARIAKVATLATPYQGSYEAVIKVATGTANLGSGAPSSREREAARLTRAWGRPAPGVADTDWKPPVRGLWNKQKEQDDKIPRVPADRPGRA